MPDKTQPISVCRVRRIVQHLAPVCNILYFCENTIIVKRCLTV
ncbi:hypothetical protein HMPREF9193_01357 [Treponema lecithinolyticum ATCC 700332]|uniref:Uncharacterized protein n=1 Tax=Treponema lecithinolyticum ATCC 700332 TaxID=1321815 RepID=A0ABN0NYA2_TRELE|nr:hypothetical protein HMPREF9193_01357 [Treponema lecithinolyticum ATCC 700332]